MILDHAGVLDKSVPNYEHTLAWVNPTNLCSLAVCSLMEETTMNSRREFLAKSFRTAVLAAVSSPVPTFQVRSALRWEVFVTPSIPVITSDVPPGEKERPWPPISATLIYGEREAVLVDAFMTVEQSRALADWVAASGKNLTTIYATHGHGDHFFGASTVLERFPDARFVARPEVVAIMRRQASPESLATFWNSRFPGQVSGHLVIAEELTGSVINLEGHDLLTIPLGFTDTGGTTCLHVPSIGLIVAGDAAYNGVHLRLVESNQHQKRLEWIAALDKMESLKPGAVVAGHKRIGNEDSQRLLRKVGNISATLSVWLRARQLPKSCTTKGSSSIPVGSTEVRSGVQRVP